MSVLRQWPLLVVVAGVVVGLGVAALTGAWRLGCLIIGATLCLGAVERGVLPRREARLLQVRGRAFDVVVYAGFGLAIMALAVLVPVGPVRD